jgi:dTDP-glucose 4,6-dehydratase
MKHVLVTGGCGFIGSHFIRHLLETKPGVRVINVDVLSYAGNVENCRDYEHNPNYVFYKADIGDYETMKSILTKEHVDTIINFAAESDNNKAIDSPLDFAKTNALGVATLLHAAHTCGVARFHHISTCEVFGQLDLTSNSAFREDDAYNPRTPYNASKAAGDHFVMSYYHTFGLPVTISYCANNYGTHQFPEKLIPVFIAKIMRGENMPIFASSGNKREWIHVLDHCKGIMAILEKGVIGERYNIGTGVEKSIMEIADAIILSMGKGENLKEIVPDRPGHDSRYLLDATKITQELGWKPEIAFEEGLRDVVTWYTKNEAWWLPLLEKSHSWKKRTQ